MLSSLIKKYKWDCLLLLLLAALSMLLKNQVEVGIAMQGMQSKALHQLSSSYSLCLRLEHDVQQLRSIEVWFSRHKQNHSKAYSASHITQRVAALANKTHMMYLQSHVIRPLASPLTNSLQDVQVASSDVLAIGQENILFKLRGNFHDIGRFTQSLALLLASVRLLSLDLSSVSTPIAEHGQSYILRVVVSV